MHWFECSYCFWTKRGKHQTMFREFWDKEGWTSHYGQIILEQRGMDFKLCSIYPMSMFIPWSIQWTNWDWFMKSIDISIYEIKKNVILYLLSKYLRRCEDREICQQNQLVDPSPWPLIQPENLSTDANHSHYSLATRPF